MHIVIPTIDIDSMNPEISNRARVCVGACCICAPTLSVFADFVFIHVHAINPCMQSIPSSRCLLPLPLPLQVCQVKTPQDTIVRCVYLPILFIY